VDLAGVMTRVRDVNPYYVDMLTWKQQDGIIKATPKQPLSELAFNTVKRIFKRLGGKFVSHAGQAWFELVLEEFGPRSAVVSMQIPQGKDFARLSPSSRNPVFRQTEARIARLVRAGQQLLTEA